MEANITFRTNYTGEACRKGQLRKKRVTSIGEELHKESLMDNALTLRNSDDLRARA